MIVKWNDKKIDFTNTGEVLDVVDCYDWAEEAEGYDIDGNEYSGIAIISCDEIIDIEDIEEVV
jgi:hypothetical protein